MKTMKLRPVMQAVSLALALGASATAFASPGVLFDQDGSGGGANVIGVSQFDWGVGNVFAKNSLIGSNTANNSTGGLSTILIQEHLSGFVPGASILAGHEFTFMLSLAATPSLTGDKLSWIDAGGTSFFRMYASDTTAANIHNDVSGFGYGDDNADGTPNAGETLILSGTVKLISMSFTQDTTLPVIGLDNNSSAPDADNGVNTIQGNGSGTFEIDVLFADAGYFLSDISSASLDLNLTGSNSTPFNTGNPSDNVVGTNLTGTTADLNAAYGSDLTGGSRVNNYDCGTLAAGGNRVCGFHMQGDHSSVVFHEFAPEPGSLALLGLGLGMIGWGARRKARKA